MPRFVDFMLFDCFMVPSYQRQGAIVGPLGLYESSCLQQEMYVYQHGPTMPNSSHVVYFEPGSYPPDQDM